MNIQAIIELIDAGVSNAEIAAFHPVSLSDLELLRARLRAPVAAAPAPVALSLRQQLLVAMAPYAFDGGTIHPARALLYHIDSLIELESETAPR